MDTIKKDFKDKEKYCPLLDIFVGISLFFIVMFTIYISLIEISGIN